MTQLFTLMQSFYTETIVGYGLKKDEETLVGILLFQDLWGVLALLEEQNVDWILASQLGFDVDGILCIIKLSPNAHFLLTPWPDNPTITELFSGYLEYRNLPKFRVEWRDTIWDIVPLIH